MVAYIPYKHRLPKDRYDNEQKLYRFQNGYGASVVKGYGSYGGDIGRWELAVITFSGDAFTLNYSTPITEDVIGGLTEEQVQEYLKQIDGLPSSEG